jgi:hypothetical protein
VDLDGGGRAARGPFCVEASARLCCRRIPPLAAVDNQKTAGPAERDGLRYKNRSRRLLPGDLFGAVENDFQLAAEDADEAGDADVPVAVELFRLAEFSPERPR